MLPLGKACPTLVEGGAAHSTEGFSYVVGSKSSPTISGSFVWFWGWVGILWWLPLTASHAQITLDGTVGPKGNLLGPNYTIGADVGRQVGGNLFHSFGEFNVHTGESATFTGSTSIQNVIGRVTGGQASEINGTLSSKIPNANLYLLNPAGVLFGPDARLDVLGSFHVSTADYLKLGDDGRFDATQPSNSVLTSAPPSAFGFLGSNPAPISIEGSSLQVPEGQTLSVIGGDITVMGRGTLEEETNLRARRGKVQIASVASPGEVAPSATEQAPLAMSGFARLGGIEVSQGGSISAQGESGGSVIIRGGRLEVTGGAVIRSNTFGSGDGGAVDIAATESITIAGHLAGDEDEVSRVASNTFNSGDAGRVSVSAPTLVIDGGTILAPAHESSTGNGGDIEVNVGRLTMSNGGQIQSNARENTTGRAGTVTVTATDSIIITGRGSGRRSGLFSQTAGAGGAGRVAVSAPTLAIEQGGAISTSVRAKGTGDGGEIEVNVGRLTLTSGGQIVNDTTKDATGSAGRVTVTAADSITIAGRCCERAELSGLVTRNSGLVTRTRGIGQGGDIIVRAPHITLDDGVISASSDVTSRGNAGNLKIRATETFRSRNGGGVTTSAAQAGGGEIALSAGQTVELVNSEVTTSVQGGSSNAGNINVTTPATVLNASTVQARADAGDGGNITIGTDLFLASPDSVVNASSDEGVDGRVDIRGVVNNLSGSLAPLTQAYQDSPVLAADRCAGRLQEGAVSSFVVTGRDGMPLQPGGILPSSLAGAAPASAGSPPEEHMAEGQKAFQHGDVETAVQRWQEAVRRYELESNPERLGNALVEVAQAYQALGQYQEALQSLSRAQAVVREPMQKALILQQVGNIYVATGAVAKAEQTLQESLALARQANHGDLQAAILNDLGNLYTTQKRYDQALTAYQECLKLVQDSGNTALVVRARTNAAVASLQREQYRRARTFLDLAAADLKSLPASHDTVYGTITVGTSYRTLRQSLPDARTVLSQRAFETLSAAATMAETLGDRRAASYAWGSLGTLYEDEQHYAEALQLTQRAIVSAQQVYAPESLYRWQWQSGRILKALGRRQEAVAAYRGAVASLQAIRQELAVQYGGTQTSFRMTIGPVYFELVDLLLQQAKDQGQDHEQASLVEARATVELLRVAELRDYFRDECVDTVRSQVVRLDVVSQSAVVVYPILLSDRTELLVSLPGGLKRLVVPVGVAVLTEEVRALRRTLEKRTTREYLPHAQRLYDWLIRPLEADLTVVSADTLVFVPDGPLRTIPMAALHDGKRFLVDKYALATTPGLDLTDPRPLTRENTQVFAAGLTEGVQGFAPLPYVSTELEAVKKLYGNTPLMNQAFRTDTVEKELREKPFSIVHIASHGEFAGDIDKSFLLTFDDKLTIDRLGQVIGFSRFRQAPLELLTLSACETAAGDDRAALGLAGIAIKAGARSALATLWAVNDEAASLLVTEFYQQLQEASLSKAQALRQAQIKLLSDHRYQHPSYWSPFLLLNNWL